jgi:hypothetical protein
MTYLLGHEHCARCGLSSIIVCRTTGEKSRLVVAGDVFECDDCGELAARVEIWFPSLYWPEVEALVRFDEERTRLKLPPLTETRFQ